jgi:peptidoglycan/LPS O-acetylase OafA/YrhL
VLDPPATRPPGGPAPARPTASDGSPDGSRDGNGHLSVETAADASTGIEVEGGEPVAAGVHAATFPAFDGLRCIAAMAVLVTHASYISGFSVRNHTWGPITARLDIGVAIFFVISGFLLYRPFVAAHLADKPRPETRGYARRRFLRIMPAYWLVLTVVLIVPVLRPHNVTLSPPSKIAAHYALVQIYAVRFGLPPVQQAWTLATEVAFYAFLPLYALVLVRFGRGDHKRALRAELIGIAVLYVFGLAWRAMLLETVHDVGRRGFMELWLPARIDHFALGMLLAVLSAHFALRRHAPRWTRSPALAYVAWAGALGAFLFMCYGFGLQHNAGPGAIISHAQEWWLYFFWGVVGLLVVLPAVFGPQQGTAVHAFLRNRVVAWLGLISYGIYLWHEAILDAILRWKHLAPANSFPKPYSFPLMTLWMAALTIPFAAASWYLLERPILRRKNQPLFGTWRRRTSR